MDANTTLPSKLKIRIGGDVVELEPATEGQLLGFAMIDSGAFTDAEATGLLLKAIMRLIPQSHRVKFVEQYTAGGHGVEDLKETFRQIVGAGGVEPEAPVNREQRRAAKKAPVKRAAKKAVPRK
jgi:hypothetical protein